MAIDGIHERLAQHIFSGEYERGSSLVERGLAERLGVSRIPVRETLSKLLAHGVLVGGHKGEGVRMRRYSAEEIRKACEYRAVLEGGVARAAASAASEADILRLNVICDEMQAVLPTDRIDRWGKLDSKFHEALAEATHNDRFERALKHLLCECFYVFYVLPSKDQLTGGLMVNSVAHKQAVLGDHRALVDLIRSRDADGAEARARLHILRFVDQYIRAFIESDIGGASATVADEIPGDYQFRRQEIG